MEECDYLNIPTVSGEIDIIEARDQDADIINHAIHYGSQWPNDVYSDKVDVTIANAQND
jgi:hypothetical protein